MAVTYFVTRMEPAGIEPATSGLQSLAQGGPFTEKISIYAGFVRISEARDSADTDQIRNSTYTVTYTGWGWTPSGNPCPAKP